MALASGAPSRGSPHGDVHDLSSPNGARAASRAGALDGPTSGLAPGFVQGNLAILPADLAGDFLHFCQRNPKPCPLIAVSEAGDPRFHALGADLDIRTDLPRYRVWKDGALIDEPQDILKWWRGDLVAFVLGCSHSFEEALIEDGLAIRHIERGSTVPMYRTSIACIPAGPFSGPMVVSMRPFRPADAIRAIQITTRFPAVHGAPVHIGLPKLIGITDLGRPDFGEPVPIADDELPVFWACGVTPQAVIQAAKPPFAITHSPGRMIVTDIRNSRLAAL
ncbi:MAG: putative hydro-lyase [Hyphomicrobiales bacterium]|nr:putative hydro-lyase [Hyphomicrobiales bacterium]